MAGDDLLCFDLFGTLVSMAGVEAAFIDRVAAASDRPAAAVAETYRHWVARRSRYTDHAALMGLDAGYRDVAARALDYTLEAHDVDLTAGDRDAVLGSFGRLDPVDGARSTLDVLGDAGHPLAVLSNGGTDLLDEATAHAGLADRLDRVLSARGAGTFKPDPAAYAAAAGAFDRPIGSCRFVSAHGWDAAGAGAAGMRAALVNRDGAPRERLGPAPDLTVASLADLPDALDRIA